MGGIEGHTRVADNIFVFVILRNFREIFNFVFRKNLGIIFTFYKTLGIFSKIKKNCTELFIFGTRCLSNDYIHTVQYTEEYIDFDNREHMSYMSHLIGGGGGG